MYKRVPAHHQAAQYVDDYLAGAGIAEQKKTPLFRSSGRGRGGHLTELIERPAVRRDLFVGGLRVGPNSIRADIDATESNLFAILRQRTNEFRGVNRSTRQKRAAPASARRGGN